MAHADPTLLVLDAAGAACVVGVWRHGGLAARAVEPMRRGQAERLVPLIAEVLGDAALAPAALDAVAVTTGPGGFTGVRLGLATARGYGLALDIPVLGLTRFEATAAMAGPDAAGRPLLVALDARRAEVCVQGFDAAGTPTEAPGAALPEDLALGLAGADWRVAGDAAERTAAALTASGLTADIVPRSEHTDPAVLGRLGADRLVALPPGARLDPPRPLYLRAPDVTPPPAPTATPETPSR